MTIKIEPAETIEKLFICEGVFSAINFAFRNASLIGIDKSSREYAEIARAYWAMPWAMDAHREALAKSRMCSDHKCKE